MTTKHSDLATATKLHNRAVAFIDSGFRQEALPALIDAFEMGLAASGRALFTLLSADSGSRERAAHVAARAALMDPMHFKFVSDALRFNIAFAVETAVPYEPIRAAEPRPWSIVVCSHNDALFDAFSKSVHRIANNFLIEIIRVSDARGMNEGYRRGLMLAKHQNVVLCHHDIDFLIPDFFDRLSQHLASNDFVGVAGATRMTGPALLFDGHPHLLGRIVQPVANTDKMLCLHTPNPFAGVRSAAVLDGVLIAAKRRTLLRLGFDQSNTTFHYYDVDLTHRASLSGCKLIVAPDLAIHHQSFGNYDQTWFDAKQRFASKWPQLRGSSGTAWHSYGAEVEPHSIASVWSWLNCMALTYDHSALAT